MAKGSEPVLAFLRGLLDKRGMNTAALATKCNLPRARVRKVLTGVEPMTLDELLAISTALEVSPTDVGLAATAEAEAQATPAIAVAAPDAEAPGPKVDPWGNQPEQLLRVGFALGCDLLFVTEVAALDGSGVPDAVLKQYAQGQLPIRLDAAFHSYNAPRYTPYGVTMSLSFDAVYECTFPWAAIKQVSFFPAAVEPEPAPEAPPKPGRPTLRLVQ
ncbi:MAG: helix-turn-helix transcriptional regulator [Myxococcota bacterium]